MKRLARQACVLAVALALGSTRQALAEGGMGKEPGARLLARCQAAQRLADPGEAEALGSSERADGQACLGFIEGFVWGHAWASWRQASDMWFCLPADFSGERGVSVVVDYLQAHAERLQEDAHLLVFLALTAAYPCIP